MQLKWILKSRGHIVITYLPHNRQNYSGKPVQCRDKWKSIWHAFNWLNFNLIITIAVSQNLEEGFLVTSLALDKHFLLSCFKILSVDPAGVRNSRMTARCLTNWATGAMWTRNRWHIIHRDGITFREKEKGFYNWNKIPSGCSAQLN